jgi:hypothetical protein
MQPRQFFTSYLEAVKQTKKANYTKRDTLLVHEFATMARRNGIFFTVNGQSYDQDKGNTLKREDIPMRPPYPVTILEYMVAQPKAIWADGVPLPRIAVITDEGDHALLTVIQFTSADFEGAFGWLPPIHTVAIPYEGPLSFSTGVLLPDAYAAAEAKYDPNAANLTPDTTFDMYCIGRVLSDYVTYKEFCRVLHEHEVTFNDVEPDAAKNKMRRARGKVPLFTYKVLTIGKPKRKSRHLGGTHASPRSHLRRGYYRTSRNGVRHWVQPCMVKGETDGFVHKDYKVEGTVH